MDLVRSARPEAGLALPRAAPRRATGRVGGDGVTVSRSAAPGAVRADLGEVFRLEYPRVVGVAARVLGSRDSAEDVAQEVFLSFGRSSVPAGEARGWLSVAAAHTALNLIRSGRRRASREESAAAADDHVAPDDDGVGTGPASSRAAGLVSTSSMPVEHRRRTACDRPAPMSSGPARRRRGRDRGRAAGQSRRALL